MAGYRKISVLVVDDSAFFRKALKRMLNSDPLIQVIGEAKDGLEAVAKTRELKPDVVTMDVKMYGMDGIEALKRIMKECPTPVLMVSSLTSEGGENTMKALDAGAVDFIDKSSCYTHMDILEIAETLIQKVKVIAGVDVKKLIRVAPKREPIKLMPSMPRTGEDENPAHLVAIGSSTGGPIALEKILASLPADYPGAILIVQHMPAGFTRSLAERLNQQCLMEVEEAREDDLIVSGKIYIAPAGYHLKIRQVSQSFQVVLTRNPRDTFHCPSADVMMESIAEVWPGRVLGIILTGMGSDGSRGVQELKKRGGTIIAQDEETCVVFGMPKAAFLSGCVDRMVPLDQVLEEICRFR
ncbi:MAG: chemotaxis response regulator protein-glutamate methylesterase [bacterium]|nr:chemotaxis response regulator protein-glutamate methylesterase [bacterium]